MTFLVFVIAFYLGNRFPYWLGHAISAYQRRKWIRESAPSEANEWILCRGRHEWTEVRAINEKGELDKLTVCDVCGFIPSRNVMIPPVGLQRMKETQKAMEIDEQIEKEFVDQEEKGINSHFEEEIQGGLNSKKLIQLYNAGQSSKQRFILYKMARKEELKLKSET